MKEEKSAVAAEQAAQQEMGELLRIRRDKLAALQQEDKNPFAITKYPVDHYAAHIKEEFAGIANEEETGKVVRHRRYPALCPSGQCGRRRICRLQKV